jgi:hypothetical protein
MSYASPSTAGKVDVSIGLRESVEGGYRQWQWVNGDAYDFKNWYKSYPKNATQNEAPRCATLVTSDKNRRLDGKWKHVPCENIQAQAICMQEPRFVFPIEARKNMEKLRLKKFQQRQTVRGDRHA